MVHHRKRRGRTVRTNTRTGKIEIERTTNLALMQPLEVKMTEGRTRRATAAIVTVTDQMMTGVKETARVVIVTRGTMQNIGNVGQNLMKESLPRSVKRHLRRKVGAGDATQKRIANGEGAAKRMTTACLPGTVNVLRTSHRYLLKMARADATLKKTPIVKGVVKNTVTAGHLLKKVKKKLMEMKRNRRKKEINFPVSTDPQETTAGTRTKIGVVAAGVNPIAVVADVIVIANTQMMTVEARNEDARIQSERAAAIVITGNQCQVMGN